MKVFTNLVSMFSAALILSGCPMGGGDMELHSRSAVAGKSGSASTNPVTVEETSDEAMNGGESSDLGFGQLLLTEEEGVYFLEGAMDAGGRVSVADELVVAVAKKGDAVNCEVQDDTTVMPASALTDYQFKANNEYDVIACHKDSPNESLAKQIVATAPFATFLYGADVSDSRLAVAVAVGSNSAEVKYQIEYVRADDRGYLNLENGELLPQNSVVDAWYGLGDEDPHQVKLGSEVMNVVQVDMAFESDVTGLALRVRAKNTSGKQSEWSDALAVTNGESTPGSLLAASQTIEGSDPFGKSKLAPKDLAAQKDLSLAEKISQAREDISVLKGERKTQRTNLKSLVVNLKKARKDHSSAKKQLRKLDRQAKQLGKKIKKGKAKSSDLTALESKRSKLSAKVSGFESAHVAAKSKVEESRAAIRRNRAEHKMMASKLKKLTVKLRLEKRRERKAKRLAKRRTESL